LDHTRTGALVAIAFAIATSVAACSGGGAEKGTDAGCSTSQSCDAAAACDGDSCAASFAVCPAGLEPTFDSIRSKILDVSCGTSGSNCHSMQGGGDSGGLVLSLDPYAALLGSDGTGARASNISGSVRGLRRVVPGDPDQSFLIIKLSTKVLNDPSYGAGMPRTAPGSLCPETLAVIRDWIAAGAKP
jgi:hypothetical protein